MSDCPDPGILSQRLAALQRPIPRPRTVGADLTDRELAVLRLLAGPLSERDIARELYASHNTIHTHTKSIFHKLDVSSRAKCSPESARPRPVRRQDSSFELIPPLKRFARFAGPGSRGPGASCGPWSTRAASVRRIRRTPLLRSGTSLWSHGGLTGRLPPRHNGPATAAISSSDGIE